MLHRLAGIAPERKLRLFLCALFRTFRSPAHRRCEITDRIIAVGEQDADGLISPAFRRQTYIGATRLGDRQAVAVVVADDLARQLPGVLTHEFPGLFAHGWGWHKFWDPLEELLGNPFRPVAFESAWRTDTVVGLARGIYDDRAFERMPILADALQEAGCEHPDILTHCREPGEHVRGCWVIDLVLGKE